MEIRFSMACFSKQFMSVSISIHFVPFPFYFDCFKCLFVFLFILFVITLKYLWCLFLMLFFFLYLSNSFTEPSPLYDNNHYHEECLRCNSCGINLSGQNHKRARRFKNQILCDLHFADVALMECSDFMQQLRSFKPQSLGCAVARRKSSTTLIFPLPPQACSGNNHKSSWTTLNFLPHHFFFRCVLFAFASWYFLFLSQLYWNQWTCNL